MIKIGTDICSVKRIEAAYAKFGARLLERILTDKERHYVLASPAHTATRIAGRFACKEATAKALGTGFHGISWKEIEVGKEASGAPTIILHGRAQSRAAKLGLAHFQVSMSHENEYTVAFVLAHD